MRGGNQHLEGTEDGEGCVDDEEGALEMDKKEECGSRKGGRWWLRWCMLKKEAKVGGNGNTSGRWWWLWL